MRFRRMLAAGAALAVVVVASPPLVAAGAPEPLWVTAQGAGGTSFEANPVVDLLGDGAAVLAGDFTGTIYFPTGPGPDDSIALLTGNSQGNYLATLNGAGTYFTWAQRIIGGQVTLGDIAVTGAATASTADDTILVAGTVNDSAGSGVAYFPTGLGDDSIAFYALGNPDMYMAALRPGGGFAWVQRVGPPVQAGERAFPNDIILTPAGGTLVVGSLTGTIDFPGASGTIQVTTPGATERTFVAAMSGDDSTFDWVQMADGSESKGFAGAVSTRGTSTVTDDSLIVSGLLGVGTAYFPTGLPAPDDSIAVTATDYSKSYLAAMNLDDSTFDWVVATSGPGESEPGMRALATASDGRIYVVGTFRRSNVSFPRGPGDDSVTLAPVANSDAYIASVSADDSYYDWAIGIGGTSNDAGTGLAVMPNGLPVMTAQFRGPITLPAAGGSIIVPAGSGGTDVLVAALDPGLATFSWVQTAQGTSGSSLGSRGIVSAGTDSVFVSGNFAGTAKFPSAEGALTLTSRGSRDAFAARLSWAQAPAPAPSPPVPASQPRDVLAEAGDASASLSWKAPASVGSFPVSHYEVISSPGGRVCLTSTLTCTVTGLSNGTAYTFTVKALTGAGWSAASEPSNAVRPAASPKPAITITGSREGKRIEVTGTTTGFGMGGTLRPWLRFPGQPAFTEGAATILVSMDGTFEWGRKSGKRVSVYVQTPDGSVRSNTVAIATR